MNDTQKFASMIKDMRFAMLTSVSYETGILRSRPMTIQETDFDGALWFFVSRHAPCSLDIADQPQVNVAFSNPRSHAFISASGQAELVFDAVKAKELWRATYRAFFPDGLEDPELCLLRVDVESVDYWESPSSSLVQLFDFAKSALTGRKVGSDLSPHGHIQIS